MSFTHLEIREIRKRLGKSQTEFGKMLGVGLRIVQRWEKGDRKISKSAAMLLENIETPETPIVEEPVPRYQPEFDTVDRHIDTISERLKEVMIQKGLNYRTMGSLIGYSDVAVGKIIKGQNNPKYEAIRSVLQHFPDLSARWLVLGEGLMNRQITAEKTLYSFHPLEIVEYIDKERSVFRKLRLFQKLVMSFVNEGIIKELKEELSASELSRRRQI